MQENRNDNGANGGVERIEPVDFTPAAPEKARWRPRLRVWHALVGLFLLAAIGAAWFVLTARSIQLETSPPTANAEISGGLAVPIGERYLIRPGDYQLRLRDPGYHELETVLSVSEEAAQTHRYELRPRPGLVDITARGADGRDLDDARVQVDGVDTGTAPLEALELEPGDYRITVTRERYLPHEEILSVAGRLREQSLEAVLEPGWAEVTFNTEPAGAEVLVNGESLGETPLRAELMQGANEVTLKLAGYKAWEDDLRIMAGEDRELPPVELEAADGLVFIRSRPGNANVTINGEFRGQTPLEVALAPDRDHRVSLFRSGYRTAERQLRTRPEEEQNVTVELEPVTAAVRIQADPPDAELYIDGELKGEANQTVELMAANQRIEIRKQGYVPYVSNFTSRPGIDQEIRVTLQTEEQARREAIEPEITTAAGQTLKLLEPHEFTMGSSRREPGRRANEALRDVVLERPFYLALHPVTNEQFQRFEEDHGSGSVEGHTLALPNQPVVEVGWLDAARYSNWLSEQEGLQPFYEIDGEEVTGINASSTGYRLPTEAEWEWAARTDGNGNVQRFAWGEEWPPPEETGNFADESTRNYLGQYLRDYDDGHLGTSNVGQFPPNAHGLYDMAGNVSEWVHDHYGAVSGLSSVTEVDPLGPDDGRYRTIKGSSWMHGTLTELRASFRDFAEEPRNDLGFRVARYLEE